MGKFSSYADLEAFTNWFDSNRVSKTEVKIKAKPGKATLIPGAAIVSSIKAKINRHTEAQLQRPGVPVSMYKSWEDYFRTNDVNCFLGVIDVKPSVENPGNTWISLKECHDATGPIADYSFACKDEKVSGVEEGSLVLGRRNQLLPDRPFFFAGDKTPVELVDWNELNIPGSVREFLERNNGKVHVDCECYFKDLLVVDNEMVYSGIQYSRETSEIYVGEECREGKVHHFLSESKQTCWMYLLDWGDDKGLFRLIAPKDESGITTKELISRVGTLLIKTSKEPSPSELRTRIWSDDNDGGRHSESVSISEAVLTDGHSPDVHEDTPNVITNDEILKVCAEVLQDGAWHNREDLLKELNQRIPCMSACGIADTDIFDGLRKFSNVAFLAKQNGDWSVQLRLIAESPVLLDECAPNSENGTQNVFCSDKEAAFLKSFIDDVLRCGYDYKPQDIVRFHTSVKSGGFTLLGGAPGSGKSTLASLYAKALGGNLSKDQDDTRYLTVDVNPSWIDPNDVLGYWNLNGKYSCASSGLVPFLRKAAKCNEVRLVCMEEMNLARVEHYFSNFIQLMSREPEDRILQGVPSDENAEGEKDNARLRLPMNIRFVGTNNFDETTQRFSARFYDRCNYIELQQTGHFDEFPKQIPSESLGKFNYGVSYKEYETWLSKDAQSSLLDSNVVSKFKRIVKKLCALNLQPSPRVKQAILEYILSRPFFEGCGSEYSSPKDRQMIALDEAIAQRVLPRYSINYLRDDAAARKELREELKDMPLSSLIFENKCSAGERPSRV